MLKFDPNKQYDESDEIEFLEAVVTAAEEMRKLFNKDDHWCAVKDCPKCKALESFDRALAELDKLQGCD